MYNGFLTVVATLLQAFPENLWNEKPKGWDPEEDAIEIGADSVEQQKDKWLFWGDVKDMEVLRGKFGKKRMDFRQRTACFSCKRNGISS